MKHVVFDYQRQDRIGMPEAVFCQGKSPEIILDLLEKFNKNSSQPILFTRLSEEVFNSFPKEIKEQINYNPLSQTAFAYTLPPHHSQKKIAIVTAGSADAKVAFETARTLEYFGLNHKVFEDCGVAGLWRFLGKKDEIAEYDIIIAIAGLDAALISVIGGQFSSPIIAVPTSVGYGMAKNGESALNSMLISCAQGISVMNIDNGYGAACAAFRICNMF